MNLANAAAAMPPQVARQLEACKAELQACTAAMALQEAEQQRNTASLATELSHIRMVKAALIESQDSYLQLVKALPVGVILHGPKRQDIILVSTRALALLGLTEAQLLGKNPYDPKWDVIHEDGSVFPAEDFPVPLVFATGQSVHDVVMGVYRPKHEDRIWLLVNASLQLDPDGTVRLVVATITDITQRKHDEISKSAQAALIERLYHRLVLAQEAARRRFSRELHERTSPNLAALRINLEIITSALGSTTLTQAYADRIEDTRALIEDTTISVREICAELHPPLLDTGGLISVVQSYALQFAKRTGLRVNVECNSGVVGLTHELELTMFRIVQEALTNCAKHARASQVLVTLEFYATRVAVSITDDGVGFDPTISSALEADDQTGHGLLNMRESTAFLAGRFTLNTAPGAGTRVGAEFDLAAEACTAGNHAS